MSSAGLGVIEAPPPYDLLDPLSDLDLASVTSLRITDAQHHHQCIADQYRNGLNPAEAGRRLQWHGLNKVEGAKGLSPLTILIRQVSNSLTLVSLTLLSAT